jgi:hypothetical protein
LASLFQSQYQDVLKMTFWTVIVFGIILTYAWPFLIDTVSRAVIVAIMVGHFVLMTLLYPLIPHHGFLVMGFAIGLEVLLCCLPVGWLDVRSQKRRRESYDASIRLPEESRR